MPRIPVLSTDSAPEAACPVLEAIIAGPGSLGRVINLQGQLANAPATLHAYVGLRRAIEQHATLAPGIRAAIQLTVSSAHDCGYSLAINTMLMKRAGWSEVDVIAVRSGHFDADPKLAALLAVVRAAALHEGTVDDSIWAEAIAAGWSAGDLVEVFVCVALTLFVDYFVAFAHTAVDVPADSAA